MEACDVMQIKEKHAATIQVVYKLCELVPLFWKKNANKGPITLF